MCWCTTCPPSVSVMLTTLMLFPGTKIFHGVFRGQAASGLRGDANEFRQNEIPWKHVRSYHAPLSIRKGLQSGLILASMLSYGTRKISIVTSITNTHCLWCFPTELLPFTGQEDGHWCFCVFRERFDNVLITQLWGALLDKGSQIRIIIPYYLVMYIILQYTRQWMVKETQQTTQTCALCLIELQRVNETFSISIKNISQISYCIKEN